MQEHLLILVFDVVDSQGVHVRHSGAMQRWVMLKLTACDTALLEWKPALRLVVGIHRAPRAGPVLLEQLSLPIGIRLLELRAAGEAITVDSLPTLGPPPVDEGVHDVALGARDLFDGWSTLRALVALPESVDRLFPEVSL